MATSRWTITIKDAGGSPRTGLTVTLRDPVAGTTTYTLTESATKLGSYYTDAEDNLYNLYVDGIKDTEYSGTTGFWIGGPDVQ